MSGGAKVAALVEAEIGCHKGVDFGRDPVERCVQVCDGDTAAGLAGIGLQGERQWGQPGGHLGKDGADDERFDSPRDQVEPRREAQGGGQLTLIPGGGCYDVGDPVEGTRPLPMWAWMTTQRGRRWSVTSASGTRAR